MSMNYYRKLLKRSERGQAIVLIIFAFVGLVAMVGLVTDTGLVLIEYGKLKRSVDAAAIAAAQEYRPDPDAIPDPATGIKDLNIAMMTNAAENMLRLNQTENVSNITVATCEDAADVRPTLCNPNPESDPVNNRKLVEVTANAEVPLAFLKVLGIRSVTLSASAVGEAATIDLVLIIDTSGSMAYETDGNPSRSSGDDPSVCNAADNCEPMRRIKDVAGEFVESLIYFGYDRVSVIAMTGQTPGADRDPVEVLPLTFSRDGILNSIDNLKVFQPNPCSGDPNDLDTPGECLRYNNGNFEAAVCQIYENHADPNQPVGIQALADPSSCPTSNIGGTLFLAEQALSGSGDPNNQRPEALWVVVLLAGGPANATDGNDEYPFGYCPANTWFLGQDGTMGTDWCRDKFPKTSRHPADAPLVSYTNPFSGQTIQISPYDAEDFAMDKADNLAAMKTGSGVTIYTIGLGEQIKKQPVDTEPAPAEFLLEYIALTAGNTLNPDINHGNYFFAPTSQTLRNIFDIIARNIATKISQ
jgi:hypothetical protein